MIFHRNYAKCWLHRWLSTSHKFLMHSLEQAARGIGLYLNPDKTNEIYFIRAITILNGAITTLNGKPTKLVDLFIYLGSNISSTKSDVNICIGRVGTAIDWLLIIWKSDEIKSDSFLAMAMLGLLYRCTTWTLMKFSKKKLDGEIHKDAACCSEKNPGSSSTPTKLWVEFKSWMRLIAFHVALIPLEMVWIQFFSLQLWVNSRAD